MINDENTRLNRQINNYYNKKENKKFIKDIINIEKNFQFLNISKFNNLSNKGCYNLIHMLIDNYNELIKSSKIIAMKIQLTFINYFHNPINDFKNLYSNVLELQEFNFKPNIYIKNKTCKNLPVIDLILKSKIRLNKIDKLNNNDNNNIFDKIDTNTKLNKITINKNKIDSFKKLISLYKKSNSLCVKLSCNYSINKQKQKLCNKNRKKIINSNEDVVTSWQFDIRQKNKINRWFASEAEEYKSSIIRHCYTQPVISYADGDIIEIKINILSKNGSIVPSSIKWNNIVYNNIESKCFLEYFKGLKKLNILFDSMRYCELENLVHLWKDAKNLDISNYAKKKNSCNINKYNSIKDIEIILSKCFKIRYIQYDFVKFFIYKLELEATTAGKIKKSKFFNFEIQILDYNIVLKNETQCLGLLNISQINSTFQIRKGETVWFYYTDIF